MPEPESPNGGERRPNRDVLALCRDPRTIEGLCLELAERALRVDCVTSLEEARNLFFASGGHAVLVLAPDVPRGIAERTSSSLRSVDPAMACVAFGRDLEHARLPRSTTRLPSLHPNSRAGTGAILRVLLGVS